MSNVSLTKIKANPSNPRIIKDERYAKLLESIKNFPEMLEKRPLICVTDADGMIYPLGGNMRLRAAKEAGIKDIPVMMADEWTEEQRRQFIIKDNVGFGEWDWEMIANEWDAEQLNEWGLDLPGFDLDADKLGEGFTLPDGDKAPFQQMTFTLADEQATVIKKAIDDIKETDDYKYAETMGNENSNGNALYLIVAAWAGQRI